MMNTVKKIMLLCCCITFVFYLMIPALAQADANWIWVYSNAKYGFNMDTNYITTHKNMNGKVDTADVWMKVTYTYDGARKELKTFNIQDVSPDVLQNGYGIYRIHIEFVSGKVIPITIQLYNSSNQKIFHKEDMSATNVEKSPFYLPVYSYLITYLAGTPDFKIMKSANREILLDKRYDKNGRLEKTYTDLSRIWLDDENVIHASQRLYKYAPDNSINEKTILYCLYDANNNRLEITGASLNRNNDGYWIDRTYTDDKTADIIPGSVSDMVAKSLGSFLTKLPAFAHRFSGGGLTLKPKLNK